MLTCASDQGAGGGGEDGALPPPSLLLLPLLPPLPPLPLEFPPLRSSSPEVPSSRALLDHTRCLATGRLAGDAVPLSPWETAQQRRDCHVEGQNGFGVPGYHFPAGERYQAQENRRRAEDRGADEGRSVASEGGAAARAYFNSC